MDGSDEQWVAQLRKGSLELCMLALLAHDERYGYQIVQGLAAAAGTAATETSDGTGAPALARAPALAVSEGTIYPLLLRLQREGLVDARWHESPAGPPRKYYRLTEAGRQALEAKAQAWEEFSRAVQGILEEGRHGRSSS